MLKILFITQKIHEQDDDLAFTILWVKEFLRQGFAVEVITLEKGSFDNSFSVYSLGKEKGVGKLGRIFQFLKLIFTLKYDKVFVHMNPEYITLGGWYWFLTGKQIFLWYTHYTMHVHLWIAGRLCKKIFAATPQSLPQFEGNSKKTILGHGIDVSFWENGRLEDNMSSRANLLSVHRICRSKRLELVIQVLKYCPENYTLDIYGRIIDTEYFQELERLIRELKFENRVFFHGPVPMATLKGIYPKYRLMVNMASETIDKTMLEGMLFGIYPITTPRNSQAIGLPAWPYGETPEDIAKFILSKEWETQNIKELKALVQEKHSLNLLVKNMAKHMK